MEIKKVILEGVTFKRGKDETMAPPKRKFNKPKGKTISGASKMKANYKARKAGR